MDVHALVQLILNNGVSFLSLSLSIVAVVVSLRISRREQINTNSWEVYREYNDDSVRRGREVTLKLIRRGYAFATRSAYIAYFGSSPDEQQDDTLNKERQAYHHLAAYYHHTGLLLNRHHLDRDFTLSLIGPGLHDRWPLFAGVASFYPDAPDSYIGIYELYSAYLGWKKRRSRSRSSILRRLRKSGLMQS